ncbi:hypothetical protein XENORESO_009613 [Xenotaenia resolanae]|uniref:Uncharacterized protein n=1 Tax=Xenotaenia resolanae TaxID=208358 RepID=A0ABV0WE67_9TELE
MFEVRLLRFCLPVRQIIGWLFCQKKNNKKLFKRTQTDLYHYNQISFSHVPSVSSFNIICLFHGFQAQSATQFLRTLSNYSLSLATQPNLYPAVITLSLSIKSAAGGPSICPFIHPPVVNLFYRIDGGGLTSAERQGFDGCDSHRVPSSDCPSALPFPCHSSSVVGLIMQLVN